jgi:hypothetical protein
MTRDQLFNALSALSATQLNAVVYKLAVPRAILPGLSTLPAMVIIEVLHWAEQQGRLDDVVHLLAEVSAPHRQLSRPTRTLPRPCGEPSTISMPFSWSTGAPCTAHRTS